jgi:hypothetical protein
MEQDFDLVINDVSYRVTTPERERVSRVISIFGNHHLLYNNLSLSTLFFVFLPPLTPPGRDGTTFRRAEFSDAIVRGPARWRTPTEEGTTFDGPAGTTSIAASSLGTSKNIHIKLFSRVRQRDGGLVPSPLCVSIGKKKTMLI